MMNVPDQKKIRFMLQIKLNFIIFHNSFARSFHHKSSPSLSRVWQSFILKIMNKKNHHWIIKNSLVELSVSKVAIHQILIKFFIFGVVHPASCFTETSCKTLFLLKKKKEITPDRTVSYFPVSKYIEITWKSEDWDVSVSLVGPFFNPVPLWSRWLPRTWDIYA